MWTGQVFHFTGALLLLGLVWVAWARLEQPFPMAFWSAAFIPVAHQVFVWLAWRAELRSSLVSKTIGFQGYLIVFFVLFVSRFVSLIYLAWLDRSSLVVGQPLLLIVTSIFALVGLYAIYSVKRYFGMARAAGADHFDIKYRSMPFVKQGIFRFTDNGMYLYAFFLLWAIALGFGSSAALVVAAFSHVYIWVHFYATEKPDIDYLYGAE